MPRNPPPKNADKKALCEWLLTAKATDISDWADIGLRHKSGVTPNDRLVKFLERSRIFGGFATRDESWGEFEKHFSTMIVRLITLERDLERLKTHPVLSLPVEGRCVWCGEDNLTEASMFLCREEGCQRNQGGFIEVLDGA